MRNDFKLFNELHTKLMEKGYELSALKGADGVTMPHYSINIDENGMMGLSRNSALSLKPLKLFPNGDDVTVDELVKMLPKK